MIYINCNWVSTWWQWSVNFYTNRKETAIYMNRNNTQNNTQTKTKTHRKIHKIKSHTLNGLTALPTGPINYLPKCAGVSRSVVLNMGYVYLRG